MTSSNKCLKYIQKLKTINDTSNEKFGLYLSKLNYWYKQHGGKFSNNDNDTLIFSYVDENTNDQVSTNSSVICDYLNNTENSLRKYMFFSIFYDEYDLLLKLIYVNRNLIKHANGIHFFITSINESNGIIKIEFTDKADNSKSIHQQNLPINVFTSLNDKTYINSIKMYLELVSNTDNSLDPKINHKKNALSKLDDNQYKIICDNYKKAIAIKIQITDNLYISPDEYNNFIISLSKV